jgi:CheY-like chemotaxis protein
MRMPQVSCIEFIRKVKSNSLLGEAPILVATTFGLSVAEQAKEAGASVAIETLFDSENFFRTA